VRPDRGDGVEATLDGGADRRAPLRLGGVDSRRRRFEQANTHQFLKSLGRLGQ